MKRSATSGSSMGVADFLAFCLCGLGAGFIFLEFQRFVLYAFGL